MATQVAPPELHTIKDRKVRNKIASLCSDYRELIEQENAVKAAKSAVMDELRDLADANHIDHLAGPTWELVKSRGATTRKVVPELLLKNGVSMHVIEASTETKIGKDYYQVRARAATK